jgi:excisionase family DNA binding protein
VVDIRLLTVREVKERLGVSLASVYAMIKRGKLVAIRIGCNSGAIRVRESDLMAYLESSIQVVLDQPVVRKLTTPALKHIRLKR